MKVIYNSIGDDIIDILMNAEIAGRTIKEIHISLKEAKELSKDIGFRKPRMGDDIQFCGKILKVRLSE